MAATTARDDQWAILTLGEGAPETETRATEAVTPRDGIATTATLTRRMIIRTTITITTVNVTNTAGAAVTLTAGADVGGSLAPTRTRRCLRGRRRVRRRSSRPTGFEAGRHPSGYAVLLLGTGIGV